MLPNSAREKGEILEVATRLDTEASNMFHLVIARDYEKHYEKHADMIISSLAMQLPMDPYRVLRVEPRQRLLASLYQMASLPHLTQNDSRPVPQLPRSQRRL